MIPENKTLLILGGYGRLGVAVARLLLRETQVAVILSGRSSDKAEKAAERLNDEFPGNRVSVRRADAANAQNLTTVFNGVDTALVCTTGVQDTESIARAALSARVDCIDLRYPQRIVPQWQALEPLIEKARLCFLTQAGHLPGLPAVLVRCAGRELKRIHKVVVATAIRVPSLRSLGAAQEIVEEFQDYRGEVFRAGQWMKAGLRQARKVHLGAVFGEQRCYPGCLEEMRNLPEQFDMEEAGVYIAGINGFVDCVVVPLIMAMRGMKRPSVQRVLSRFLMWGINTFSRSPFGAVLKLEAEGEKTGGDTGVFEVVAYHGDSYYFAAAAVVAGLMQYFDGSIARPGLRVMGHEVDPIRLLSDMRRFGVTIQRSWKE